MKSAAFRSRLDASFRRFQRKGDARALGDVFDRAAPEMLRVARGFARGDESLAEDAVQSAFLAAMEKAATFDSTRRVMPWLLGLLAIELRRARRDVQRVPNPEWLREGAALRSPADPERVAADAELGALIQAKVGELPETYRTAVEQHLFSSDDAKTIAGNLGISAGALHVRVHRGLGLLRGLLPAGAALGAGLVVREARGLASMRSAVLSTGAGAAASSGVFAASQWTLVTAAAAGLAVGGAGVAFWQQREVDVARREVESAAVVATLAPDSPDTADERVGAESGLRRALEVERERLAPASSVVAPSAENASAPTDWLARYRAAEGYTELFVLGRELVALPGGEGLAIARSVYPLLAVEQRQQFAKPFVFQEGATWGLEIVDLVANDEDPRVRAFAWSFLQAFAFRDFSHDPGAYVGWRAATVGRSRRDVLLTSANDLALRTAGVGDHRVLSLLTDARPPADRGLAAVGLERRELFGASGFGVQLQRWLASPNEALVAAALPWAPYADLGASSYRTYVLPLLDHASPSVALEAARALAKSGFGFAADELFLRFGEDAAPNADEARSLEFWIRWTQSAR